MSTLISIFVIITCILLVLVILIQNPKGGGLAAEFSSSNQFMGVRRTADFLEKTTWTLAVVLLTLSFVSSVSKGPNPEATQDIEIQEQIDEMPIQNVPSFPTDIPNPGN